MRESPYGRVSVISYSHKAARTARSGQLENGNVSNDGLHFVQLVAGTYYCSGKAVINLLIWLLAYEYRSTPVD